MNGIRFTTENHEKYDDDLIKFGLNLLLLRHLPLSCLPLLYKIDSTAENYTPFSFQSTFFSGGSVIIIRLNYILVANGFTISSLSCVLDKTFIWPIEVRETSKKKKRTINVPRTKLSSHKINWLLKQYK